MSGLMDLWDGTHHDLDAMSRPDSWGKKRMRADCDQSCILSSALLIMLRLVLANLSCIFSFVGRASCSASVVTTIVFGAIQKLSKLYDEQQHLCTCTYVHV